MRLAAVCMLVWTIGAANGQTPGKTEFDAARSWWPCAQAWRAWDQRSGAVQL